MPSTTSLLPSWNDTRTRHALVEFIEAVTREDRSTFVPPEERIAVFDNDGTLLAEKPMPIELGFILERLVTMANEDRSLRTQQPWRAAVERDFAWFGGAIDKHYAGDNTDVKTLMRGFLQAFCNWSVEDYARAAGAYVRDGRHPTLERSFMKCGYRPMVELLRCLEANGFSTYIASGGNRDFIRTFAAAVYAIPPERVIGTSEALRYDSGTVSYQAEPDVFDDGPAKPVRIWSRIGRRPLFVAGNSNGDVPMLEYAGGTVAMRVVIRHDDEKREFAYAKGAEAVLQRASADSWTVVSMRDDWSTMFVR